MTKPAVGAGLAGAIVPDLVLDQMGECLGMPTGHAPDFAAGILVGMPHGVWTTATMLAAPGLHALELLAHCLEGVEDLGVGPAGLTPLGLELLDLVLQTLDLLVQLPILLVLLGLRLWLRLGDQLRLDVLLDLLAEAGVGLGEAELEALEECHAGQCWDGFWGWLARARESWRELGELWTERLQKHDWMLLARAKKAAGQHSSGNILYYKL